MTTGVKYSVEIASGNLTQLDCLREGGLGGRICFEAFRIFSLRIWGVTLGVERWLPTTR